MATYYTCFILFTGALSIVSGLSTTVSTVKNPCIHGCPYVDPVTHVQAYCGFGASAGVCTVSHSCKIGPADGYAVCCPNPTSVCPHGDPLVDLLTGKDVFCGRGTTHQACPTTHTCHVHALDAYAVCCPKDIVKC